MKYELTPICSEADYESALKKAEAMFDMPEPAEGSAEAAYFEALMILIEAYENKHYALDEPTPVEAIKFRMEQEGLSIADMKDYIGPSNRVYEVFSGTRKLTLSMIRRLAGLGVPAEILIR